MKKLEELKKTYRDWPDIMKLCSALELAIEQRDDYLDVVKDDDYYEEQERLNKEIELKLL